MRERALARECEEARAEASAAKAALALAEACFRLDPLQVALAKADEALYFNAQKAPFQAVLFV